VPLHLLGHVAGQRPADLRAHVRAPDEVRERVAKPMGREPLVDAGKLQAQAMSSVFGVP
jgi:hypothetical protein